jgi:hypothetical protein
VCLHYKFLCRDQFLETDFMTREGISLKRLEVPRGLGPASRAIPHTSPPLLPTLSNPQPLEVSPQNCNISIMPSLPLPSEMIAEEYSLQFLPPLRTYSKSAFFPPLVLRHLLLLT